MVLPFASIPISNIYVIIFFLIFQYRYPSNPTGHTHPPEDNLAVHKAMSKFRATLRQEAANNSTTAQGLINNVLSDTPDEVRSRLVKLDSLKRDVRRYRKTNKELSTDPMPQQG